MSNGDRPDEVDEMDEYLKEKGLISEESESIEVNPDEYSKIVQERFPVETDFSVLTYQPTGETPGIVQVKINENAFVDTQIYNKEEENATVVGRTDERPCYRSTYDKTLPPLHLPIEAADTQLQEHIKNWQEAVRRAVRALNLFRGFDYDAQLLIETVHDGLTTQGSSLADQVKALQNELKFNHLSFPFDEEAERSFRDVVEILKKNAGSEAVFEQAYNDLTVERNQDEQQEWLQSQHFRYAYFAEDAEDERIVGLMQEANEEYSDDAYDEIEQAILKEKQALIDALQSYFEEHWPRLQAIAEAVKE